MQFLDAIKNYAIITGVIWLLIQCWALFRTSSIERVLLTEEKKIILDLVKITIFSIFLVLLEIDYLEWKTDTKFGDETKQNQNKILIFLFTCTILLTTYIYFMFRNVFFTIPKRRYYFYNSETKEKLYILKAISKEEVLLSNERIPSDRSYYLYTTKEFLQKEKIYCDIYISSYLKNVIIFLKRKKAKNKIVKPESPS
jgi:hypothetical protein